MVTNVDAIGIRRTQTGPVIQSAAAEALGQGDFLRLLTAQMKNQDPFDPVDNTQMVAQMAQFSSLAGITEMSTTLKSIADKLGAGSASGATAYIGRTVLTEGSTAYARTTGGIAGEIELDAPADAVRVSVVDAEGRVLRTFDLGAQAAGTVAFDWDGVTAEGGEAGPGPFTVAVSAVNDGEPVAARPLVWAPVQSVSLGSGKPVLDVAGLGQVPVTAVRRVG